jgi:hypothetical protein
LPLPFREQADGEAPTDLISDNGQVERMNRTIKGRNRQTLLLRHARPAESHLRDFVDAYNFARRLKTLRGPTPYEFIYKTWTSQPDRFKVSPLQAIAGTEQLGAV